MSKIEIKRTDQWDFEYISQEVLAGHCGNTVLQIGARPGKGWLATWDCFCNAGFTQHDILEIWEKNVTKLQEIDTGGSVVLGDVRKIKNIKLPLEQYDWLVWQHGPEHIRNDEFKNILPDLLQRCNIGLLIGCPNGTCYQDAFNGNPHEEHVMHWQPEDFIKLGFNVVVAHTTNIIGWIYKK